MMQAIKNIYQLGKKEILSLCRDWLLMALIVYSFTAAIIVASNASTDFADAAISRGSTGAEVYLGTTSAIMNSLSTYGYGVVDAGALTNTEKESAGQGPNRGMSRRQNMSRITNFGPYQKAAEDMAALLRAFPLPE